MIKVSVIIPVYNVENYLRRCLDSVTNQTLKDIEIICVNDGSTDSSRAILEEYAPKDDRFICIDQKNSGICVARNTGLEIVKGEYTAFLDSDDYIEDCFYEKLYNTAKKHNADIACASVQRINDKKKRTLFEYKEEIAADDVKTKYELANYPKHCYVWNKIYKTDSLKKSGIKFEQGVVYEDMLFTPDVLESLGTLVTVPGINYYYWKQANSLIRSISDKSRADKIINKTHLLDKCRKYNVTTDEKDKFIMKKEIFFLGIKLIKIYQNRATKRYYLFGLIPFLTIKDNV